ncbi:MAG: hypothetical protein WBN55_04725 [Eudoraea sp.]|uniref:hypothetical protein n=1 Tax=Eudoraea sp. TaxID=1979955 RepID=UPI003C775CB0
MAQVLIIQDQQANQVEKFIREDVWDSIYNYIQNNIITREKIKVGLAYGSDVQLGTTVLLSCLAADKEILMEPKPFVLFDDLGDSSLLFSINFYINHSFRVLKIKSRIRYIIDSKFQENNIKIPLPQRDVHLFKK